MSASSIETDDFPPSSPSATVQISPYTDAQHARHSTLSDNIIIITKRCTILRHSVERSGTTYEIYCSAKLVVSVTVDLANYLWRRRRRRNSFIPKCDAVHLHARSRRKEWIPIIMFFFHLISSIVRLQLITEFYHTSFLPRLFSLLPSKNGLFLPQPIKTHFRPLLTC